MLFSSEKFTGEHFMFCHQLYKPLYKFAAIITTHKVSGHTYNNAYGSDGTLTFIANQSSSFYIKNLLLHMKSIVDTSDSHRQTDGRTDGQTDR